jgi:predicted nucleic acid-binding protein
MAQEELAQIGARALVLDANIVLRAVLGRRVRTLVEQYGDQVCLLTPASCIAEVNEYLPALCRKRAWELAPSRDMLQGLLGIIQTVEAELFSDFERESRQRIAARDPNDWPVLALALAVNCPIWTEDPDFFGTGVATWTTDTVELYLRENSGTY